MPQLVEETQNVQYHISTFVDDEADRQNVMDAIESFKTSNDVKGFTYVLKHILDKPERLRLYDVIRRVVPLELQAEYNRLIPPVNTKSRNVKLTRPHGSTSFGFSIRGGKEHGTGVFVSEVENNSEAYFKGLLVGDQIIRVNKMPLEDAIHDEVIRLIKSRSTVTLEVKSMGMLPIKKISTISMSPSLDHLYEDEILNDYFSGPVNLSEDDDPVFSPLTSPNYSKTMHRSFSIASSSPSTSSRKDSTISWKMVNDNNHLGRNEIKNIASSSTASTSSEHVEVKYFIDLTGRQKFGCSICKGPRERPGIFIFSTKEDGLARDAGLQPGDQLLEANGRDLMHMPFSEAVDYLKTRHTVELLIRKRVGADMFPGESSGYNSSSSSAHEEQLSPPVFQDTVPNTDMNQANNFNEGNMDTDDVTMTLGNGSDSDSDSDKSQEITVEPSDILATAAVATAIAARRQSRRDSLEDNFEHNEQKMNMMREEEEARQKNEEKLAERRRSEAYAYRLEDQRISDAIMGEAQLELQKKKEAANSIENHEKATLIITQDDLEPIPSMSHAPADTSNKQEKFRKRAFISTAHPTIEDIADSAKENDNQKTTSQPQNGIKSPAVSPPVKETLQQNGSVKNTYKEFNLKQNHDQVLEEFHQAQNTMYALTQQKNIDIEDDDDIQEDEIMPLRTRKPSLYVPLLSPSTHAFVNNEKPMQRLHQAAPLTIVESKEDPKNKMTDSKQHVPKPPNYFFPNDAKVVVTISAYQARNDNKPQRMEFLKSQQSIELDDSVKSPATPKVLDKPATPPVSNPTPLSPPIKVSNTTVVVNPTKTNVESPPIHTISVSKVTVNKTLPQPQAVPSDQQVSRPRTKSVLDRWKPNMVASEPLSTIDRVSKRQRPPTQGNNTALPFEPIIIMQSGQR